MADEPIDLDFVGLSPEEALAIVDRIVASCVVEWARYGDDDLPWPDARALVVERGLDPEYARPVCIRCRQVPLGACPIDIVAVYLGMDGDAWFVELSFVASSVARQQWGILVEEMHGFAVDVSLQVGGCGFYAGIMAETDRSCRLFTGSEMGPVRFDAAGVRWPGVRRRSWLRWW